MGAVVFVLATPTAPCLERLAITERPITQNFDFPLFAHKPPRLAEPACANVIPQTPSVSSGVLDPV